MPGGLGAVRLPGLGAGTARPRQPRRRHTSRTRGSPTHATGGREPPARPPPGEPASPFRTEPRGVAGAAMRGGGSRTADRAEPTGQPRACARRARRSPPAPRKSAPPGVSAAGGESGDPRGAGAGRFLR